MLQAVYLIFSIFWITYESSGNSGLTCLYTDPLKRWTPPRGRVYTHFGGGRMKLRKWTSEEKMAIVLEGIKRQKSIAEICREHQISQTLF